MGWVSRLFGKADRAARQQAQEATASADASHSRAQADLTQARKGSAEAEKIAKTLRDHNKANGYDDWLATVARRK